MKENKEDNILRESNPENIESVYDETEDGENLFEEMPDEDEVEEKILPTPLKNLRTKQYLVGFSIIILCVGYAIVAVPKAILFSFLGIILLFKGFMIEHDYHSGRIAEITLICTSARMATARDSAIVSFMSTDNVPSFFQFSVPSRKSLDIFIPNGVYIVYFNKSTPNTIMAYISL